MPVSWRTQTGLKSTKPFCLRAIRTFLYRCLTSFLSDRQHAFGKPMWASGKSGVWDQGRLFIHILITFSYLQLASFPLLFHWKGNRRIPLLQWDFFVGCAAQELCVYPLCWRGLIWRPVRWQAPPVPLAVRCERRDEGTALLKASAPFMVLQSVVSCCL